MFCPNIISNERLRLCGKHRIEIEIRKENGDKWNTQSERTTLPQRKDTGVGTLRRHGKEADPASPRNERWKKSINVMETWGQLREMEQDRESWNSSG